MPRANRHFLAGCIWHITHRCHPKQFLLKFFRDRRRYLHWVFQTRERFGLCVLNYMVTSNHVHLLVKDTGGDVIAQSTQLIAGSEQRDRIGAKKRSGQSGKPVSHYGYPSRYPLRGATSFSIALIVRWAWGHWMHVFIDESGSFTGFHAGSISVVGALAIPDEKLGRLKAKYAKIRARLPLEKGEVKGRLLNENQINEVVTLLARNEVSVRSDGY